MYSDWENFPHHLLFSVIERLASQSDYLMLSLVCKPWLCVAKDKQSQLVAQRLPTSPMLLIHNEHKDTWKVYNPMRDKVLDFQLKLINKNFCGSSKGWLIALEEELAVTLINPFLRIEGKAENESSVIRLPQLRKPPHMREAYYENRLENYDKFAYKATISADPISDADNCIVMVTYRDYQQLAFFRLGKDTEWNYVDGNRCYIEEVAHFKGKFYALQKRGPLFSFHINSSSISCLEELVRDEEDIDLSGHIKQYLVSINEKELLMVRRFFYYEQGERRVTKNFRIFKLDFDKHEWLEENTLGDGVLFVGDNSTVYVSASSFPGCQPNCIHFTHDNEYQTTDYGPYGSPHDFGVYDVKTQSFSQPHGRVFKTLMEKRPFDLLVYDMPTLHHPIWAMSTLKLDALSL